MIDEITVSEIRIDGGTQPRIEIDEHTVSEYAESIEQLPPITVFYDGSAYWLADGFHRWHAHRLAGRSKIAADSRPGSRRDAILYSVGANSSHGLRRSNADKRRAVETMLADTEWSKWSDRKIADQCHVSAPFVGAMRRPEVAAQQKENRTANAVKVAESVCNPITPPTVQDVSEISLPDAIKQISPLKLAPEQSAPEPDEYDGAPDEDEIQAALAADAADRRTLDMLLAADDKLAAAHSEIKRLNAEVAVLKGQRNQFQNEAAEWKRRAKRAEREAERAGRTKGAGP